MKMHTMTPEEAETVAIQAVGFLAADEKRLDRFLALTGLGAGDFAEGVHEPAFLAGTLDHILSDETLLFLFCDHAGLPPEHPGIAHAVLAGGGNAEAW
jgi:hypothetical protein